MTGIMTGSVYNYPGLRRNGYPGEPISNGSVIAVKTHSYTPKTIAQFDRAILLIRDPFGCLLVRVLTFSAQSIMVFPLFPLLGRVPQESSRPDWSCNS